MRGYGATACGGAKRSFNRYRVELAGYAHRPDVLKTLARLSCLSEHYNPLARYALMADGEQTHSAMYQGSFGGDIFSEQP